MQNFILIFGVKLCLQKYVRGGGGYSLYYNTQIKLLEITEFTVYLKWLLCINQLSGLVCTNSMQYFYHESAMLEGKLCVSGTWLSESPTHTPESEASAGFLYLAWIHTLYIFNCLALFTCSRRSVYSCSRSNPTFDINKSTSSGGKVNVLNEHSACLTREQRYFVKIEFSESKPFKWSQSLQVCQAGPWTTLSISP